MVRHTDHFETLCIKGSKLSFIKLNYEKKIFFLVFFTRKNCENEAKMSNLTNIRRNGIQNIDVDIAVMCSIKNTELFELKISIRSTVLTLILKEWSEGKNGYFCCLKRHLLH